MIVTKDLYVVMGTSGEYSDRLEWAVKAFLDEELAKSFVLEMEDISKEKQVRYEQLEKILQSDELNKLFSHSWDHELDDDPYRWYCDDPPRYYYYTTTMDEEVQEPMAENATHLNQMAKLVHGTEITMIVENESE